MRGLTLALLSLALFVMAVGPVVAAGGGAVAALERLKTLEGTWTGMPEGSGAGAEAEAEAAGEVTHVFQVSANGTVVMETMNPGTAHEMINMYHLDGDDLVLTHYCAGGNQPRMRWVAEESGEREIVFDFDSATNLEPGGAHIHDARIAFADDGSLESVWTAWNEGQPAGGMKFNLSRVE